MTASFDHHSPYLSEQNVWDTYEKMRNQCPVAHSDEHGGFWILTRFADVKAATRDPETFSSSDGIRIPSVGPGRSIPIDFDPPVHTAYRALLAQALTPNRIREVQPYVTDLISRLVDEFHDAGGGDAVAAVALPLPLQVLTQVVGFTQDTVSQLREVTERSWDNVVDMSLDEARRELRALVENEMQRHRDQRPEDYLTWLLDAEVDGRPVTDDEIARALLTLAIAGHETTVNAVGGLIYLLASDDGLQTRLREQPELIPSFVEEVLRVRTPAQLFGRHTRREVEIDGVTIPADQPVLLAYAAANRDERKFPQGAEVDLDNAGRAHLAFGWGIHQCVGAALARHELKTVTEKFCDLPRIRLDGPVTFGELQGGIHLGPRQLPIRFEN